MELLEFYPTPKTLLEKILDSLDLKMVSNILEPSAGKGDIVSFIQEKAGNYPHYNERISIDCIEKDHTLQSTLRGNGMRLVHDDFLTFRSAKSYDLIIMNPPFSEGDKHLLKAIDMQERSGGDVICILNAETLRNPYTNIRKELLQKLTDNNAVIEYMTQEFTSAERTTDVEIAVIKVHFGRPEHTSRILESLKKKAYSEGYTEDISDLAPSDYVEAIVKQYELEIEAGINLIHEYWAMLPRLMPSVDEERNKYGSPILELKSSSSGLTINSYVEQVRMKYWSAVFTDKRIVGNMTSNLRQEYQRKVNELKDYDFSVFNIHRIQEEMARNITRGVEECIISLFDELSHKYHYFDEGSKNVHYYNGWKTNKAYIINKKVIIPFYNAYNNWDKRFRPTDYRCVEKLSDIEKALNYLDGGRTWNLNLISCLQAAENRGQNRNIDTKYFTMTFYKKGTCHLVFKDDELLKKFNIFGSQKKGWLPQTYGKKAYRDMEPEEKAVIDEFEGETSYNATMADREYYLFDASKTLSLEDRAA